MFVSSLRRKLAVVTLTWLIPALGLLPVGGAVQAETAVPNPDEPWTSVSMWFTPMPAIFASGPQFEALGAAGRFTFDASGYTFATADPDSGAFATVRMQFELGRAQSLRATDRLSGIVNDLRGTDPAALRRKLPAYGRLVYQGLYPGIDLAYEGRPGRLKGLFTVAAGADPANIQWRYAGAEKVEVTQPNGELWIKLPRDGHYLVSGAPIAWQELGARKLPVSASYQVSPDGRVSFALGEYDNSQPLIIDPYLNYAVVVGGSAASGD